MTTIPKTALVTGGAQRVGKAIVEGLAAAGYSVAIHYNNSVEPAEGLAKEVVENGGKAGTVQGNLCNDRETSGIIESAAQDLGPIGLLVNNASTFEEDSILEINPELWDRHFQVHVKAPSILTAEFAKQLPDQSHGLVVNMIDERVWKLTPNFYSYTLSKSALWAATQTMAQALAPRIRVNAIGPGPTLPSHRQTQQDFDTQVKSLLLQTTPDLTAFARTILYLADSPSITGQMIALDGGQHLGWETPDQRAPE